MKRTVVLLMSVSVGVLGQDFELQAPACTYAFPTPCGALGDLEGVSWNASTPAGTPAFGATVSAANGLGMPAFGLQFLRVQCAAAPTGVIPALGPIPPAMVPNEVYVPVVPGAAWVTLAWDFYSAEGAAATTFNDAGEIDVIGACGGAALASLLWVDTNTPSFPVVDPPPCGVVFFSPAGSTYEVLPAGPQYLVGVLPPGAVYLRLRAANSSDNSFPSHLVVDDIAFGFGPPPPVPCSLLFTSPLGPASVQMTNTACAASVGLSYFTVIDLTGGLYPNGWWFGLDIGFNDLIGQYNFGFPFTGSFDPFGGSITPVFTPAPSGLTLYAVTTEWGPGFTGLARSRAAVVYVIP